MTRRHPHAALTIGTCGSCSLLSHHGSAHVPGSHHPRPSHRSSIALFDIERASWANAVPDLFYVLWNNGIT